MVHYETRRLVPGAKYAVLFLHGIVGTPNHFRIVLPMEEMVPEGWSLINVCYPGHGGDVKAFGKSNMDHWRFYARSSFLELAAIHEKVIVVGHSMGTLFALQLAEEFPEKTASLFLLAVPLRLWMGISAISRSLRVAFHKIRDDKPVEVSTRNACGVDTNPYIWQYIPWIPRFMELFREISRTEKRIAGIQAPCAIWQSGKDELVRGLTTQLLRKNEALEVWELNNSSHFYYPPEDAEILCREFENVLKKISG